MQFLTGQNEWLRQNCYDSLGNYLYCNSCIQSALGVSKDRLAKQCNIKCQQSQVPIADMTKAEIEKQRLSAYVLMPETLLTNGEDLWSPQLLYKLDFLMSVMEMQAKYLTPPRQLYERNFLNLLMPTHNQMDDQQTPQASQYILFQNSLQFKCLKVLLLITKKDRVDQLLANSTEFKENQGKEQYRPKVAMCPHQEDYCDTCSKVKNQDSCSTNHNELFAAI